MTTTLTMTLALFIVTLICGLLCGNLLRGLRLSIPVSTSALKKRLLNIRGVEGVVIRQEYGHYRVKVFVDSLDWATHEYITNVQLSLIDEYPGVSFAFSVRLADAECAA